MSCIRISHDKEELNYRCCCGCNLFAGVQFIYFTQILYLLESITRTDEIVIIVSGVIVFLFTADFCWKDDEVVRLLLFGSYIVAAVMHTGTLIDFCLSQSSTTITQQLCNQIGKTFDWGECSEDITHEYSFLVTVYILLVILVRVFLALVLYYHYKLKVLEPLPLNEIVTFVDS